MRVGPLTLILLLTVVCLVIAIVAGVAGQWERFWSCLVIALLLYTLGCLRKE